MLHFALAGFVIALITSLLGFGGIAGLSVSMGWIFAVIAVIFLAVACLVVEVAAAVAQFRDGRRGGAEKEPFEPTS